MKRGKLVSSTCTHASHTHPYTDIYTNMHTHTITHLIRAVGMAVE